MADFNNLKNIKTMKKILLAVSAVALMFAGCTKDLTNDVVGSAAIERGAIVEKTLVFEQDSRVERDGVSGKLAWSEGDQVQVVLAGENGALALDAQKYTVDHVNGKVGIPENTAYVLYMPNKPTLNGATASFDLPHNVTLANPEAIFDHNPMKGIIEGDVITFQNMLGYIKVPVKGASKLQNVIVRTICRTTSEFYPISKAATLDLSKNLTEDGGVKMATNNSAFSFLKYTYSGGLDITEGKDLYIAIPEGEYANMGLTFVTDKGSHTIYANNKHAVVRSAIKPISSESIDLAAHTPENPVSLAGTTGKACEDYARCYMVPPTAGSYEFPCILADGTVLVKGSTAELKWAEEAGLLYDFHYNPETNKISFKTNGKKGNALVVLTDVSNGTIIWHWHIWITDTPKVVKVNNTYFLMDRVVGATWSPSEVIEATSTQSLGGQTVSFNNTISLEDASNAAGIHFQFQNCTPYPRIKSLGFIGAENISTMLNTRCDVQYGFSQYAQYWSTSASGANVYTSPYAQEGQTLYIHNGIKMPNYMYMVSGKGSAFKYEKGQWVESTNQNVNSWIIDNIIQKKDVNSNNPLLEEGKYRFWCSVNNNNHDTMMQGKTSYDPCPPGYIMENYSMLYWYMVKDAAMKAKFGYARAKEDNAVYKSGYKFYGMYYNEGVDASGKKVPLYWPCDGNRSNAVGGVSGQYANCGYLYSVNTNNDHYFTLNGKTYSVGAAVAFGEVGSSYTAPSLVIQSADKIVNGQAYTVRCRRGKF